MKLNKVNVKIYVLLAGLATGVLLQNAKAAVVESQESNVTIPKSHAKALQTLAKEEQVGLQSQSIVVTPKLLTDNKGNKYIGALVSKASLQPYLAELTDILGEQFSEYRRRQSARDHGVFHLTLVSPPEYQGLGQPAQLKQQSIRVSLHGLGKVSRGDDTCYFVVATSSDGQFYRQNLLLKNKDFHVTLGFNAHDIHGVAKDKTTLMANNKNNNKNNGVTNDN